MPVNLADNEFRSESRGWHAYDDLLAVDVARRLAPALLVDDAAGDPGQRHLPS